METFDMHLLTLYAPCVILVADAVFCVRDWRYFTVDARDFDCGAAFENADVSRHEMEQPRPIFDDENFLGFGMFRKN